MGRGDSQFFCRRAPERSCWSSQQGTESSRPHTSQLRLLLSRVNSDFLCEAFRQQSEGAREECASGSFGPATVSSTTEGNQVWPGSPSFIPELLPVSSVVSDYLKEIHGRDRALPWRPFWAQGPLRGI